MNGMVFGKALVNIKCVLIICTSLSKPFLIIRKLQLEIVINIHRPSFRVAVVILSFNRGLNFLDSFGNILKTKFNGNPSSGSRVVPRGRTERQTDGRTNKQIYRQTHRDRQRQTDRDRQTVGQTYRQTVGQKLDRHDEASDYFI
jgi:hypothetical protein